MFPPKLKGGADEFVILNADGSLDREAVEALIPPNVPNAELNGVVVPNAGGFVWASADWGAVAGAGALCPPNGFVPPAANPGEGVGKLNLGAVVPLLVPLVALAGVVGALKSRDNGVEAGLLLPRAPFREDVGGATGAALGSLLEMPKSNFGFNMLLEVACIVALANAGEGS